MPVRHKGLGWPRINEVEIDNQTAWGKKHIGTIRQFYAKAPYLTQYLPMLEDQLLRPWTLLADLDLSLIALMCEWLQLQRTVIRASSLDVEGDRNERLCALCKHFDATRYLSGDSAKTYLDRELFARNGIEVAWQGFQHPVYPQQHGEFVPFLSALDLVLNCGPDSA